jgi:polar amino acid transport system substrate-binding protein
MALTGSIKPASNRADFSRSSLSASSAPALGPFLWNIAAGMASPKATHVEVAGVDAAVLLMKAGKIDCIALSRESLTGLLPEIAGAYIIDGGFLNSTAAIAVPNGKPEALAYVSQFIDEANSGGLVRKAFDDIGLETSQVAPAGLKP